MTHAIIQAAILIAIFPLGTIAVLGVLRVWVHLRVRRRIYMLDRAIPPVGTAIVLGAGLWSDGSLTPVLYDRVVTGVYLYRSRLITKLLMSGYKSARAYNEPEAMRQCAVQLGVPAEDIALDYAGNRTYDSLYRARNLFGIKRAAVVTQRFHLDRALYLCDALGIDAVGVVADRQRYRFLAYQRSRLREVLALLNAWLDIHFLHPRPLSAEPSSIEPASE